MVKYLKEGIAYMRPTGCAGCIPAEGYKEPSEKQREVWALAREVECAEYMLENAKKRHEKALAELAIEKES